MRPKTCSPSSDSVSSGKQSPDCLPILLGLPARKAWRKTPVSNGPDYGDQISIQALRRGSSNRSGCGAGTITISNELLDGLLKGYRWPEDLPRICRGSAGRCRADEGAEDPADGTDAGASRPGTGCGPQPTGQNVRRAIQRLNVTENPMVPHGSTEFWILPFLPLKRSTKPVCIALPGGMSCQSILFAAHHFRIALEACLLQCPSPPCGGRWSQLKKASRDGSGVM